MFVCPFLSSIHTNEQWLWYSISKYYLKSRIFLERQTLMSSSNSSKTTCFGKINLLIFFLFFTPVLWKNSFTHPKNDEFSQPTVIMIMGTRNPPLSMATWILSGMKIFSSTFQRSTTWFLHWESMIAILVPRTTSVEGARSSLNARAFHGPRSASKRPSIGTF